MILGKHTAELPAPPGFAQITAPYFHQSPEHLYVNCWCLAAESIAMWEIYGSGGEGIAIRSTIERYKRAAKFDLPRQQFALDAVQYHSDIDQVPDRDIRLDSGPIPMPGQGVWEKLLRLAFHKRRCFEYEREWRAALYQDERPELPGCTVDVNLDELVGEVYLGPRAETYLFDGVSAILEKFGLNRELHRSELLMAPGSRAETATGG